MSRSFALALIGIMLAVVLGQAVQLRGAKVQPVTDITLHESRLVTFLQEIRPSSPDTYDSILLNLTRLRDAQALGQEVQLEEAVVAQQLLARIEGRAAEPGAAALK